MSSGDRSIQEALADAGWTMVRQGKGSHTIWRCPCGMHGATIPMGRKSHDVAPRAGNPILKRINQCKDLMTLAGAAVAPAGKVEEMAKSHRPGARWNPGATLKGATKPSEAQVFPVQTRQAEPPPWPRPVNGEEVLVAEPALAFAPYDVSKLVPVAGGSKLLLASGAEVYGCHDCEYIGVSGVSVRTHRRIHNPERSTRGRDDRAAAVEKLVAAVRAASGEHAPSKHPNSLPMGVYAAAANALNAAGVPSHGGRKWTQESARQAYGRYTRSHASPAVQAVAAAAPEPVVAEEVTAVLAPEPILGEVRGPHEAIAEAVLQVKRLTDQASKILEELAQVVGRQPDVDPEVVEKARKYDQLRQLMG